MKSANILFLTILINTITYSARAQSSFIYLHTANSSSIVSNRTHLDNEAFNAKPFLYCAFTHNFNPKGAQTGIFQPNYLGLYNVNQKWYIYDEGLNNFIPNTSYNIFYPEVGTLSWTHVTKVENIGKSYTIIDHPYINGDPNAQIFVSHVYGDFNSYHRHTIGVVYQASSKKWAIFNQDNATMNKDLSFNVVIIKATSDIDKFVHTADSSNINKYYTTLDNPLLNNNPDAKIVITQLYNPAGSLSGVYNDHPVGVLYDGMKWAIFNEDQAKFELGASFNVVIINETTSAKINDKELEAPSLRIGPNPVIQGDVITIGMFNQYNELITLNLLDAQGRLVMSKQTGGAQVLVDHISTDGLTKGMYILQIVSPNMKISRRLIIQ